MPDSTTLPAVPGSPPETVRIFIGTEAKTKVPEDVLRWSILKNTEHPVEIISMIGDDWKVPDGLHQGTGFSLRRWMIPQACGFEGRAIYMDADQLVFGDVWDLWTQPEQHPKEGAEFLCSFQNDKHYKKEPGMQSSVMVIDCAAAHYWKLDDFIWPLLREKKVMYWQMMHATWLRSKPVQISTAWNHFNRYEEGYTKLLHYTREAHQPWYKPEHAESNRWRECLCQAIRDGAVQREDVQHAINHFGRPPKEHRDRRRTYGLHPHYKSVMKEFG